VRAVSPGVTRVEECLAPIRRREAARLVGAASLSGLAAAAGAVAAVAWMLGPVPHPASIGVAWTALALGVCAVLARPVRELLRLRGQGAARVLARVDGSLASAARSAWELAGEGPSGGSPDLVLAHRASVVARLKAVRPADVVPIRPLEDLRVRIALGVIAAACLAFAANGRARAGLFALTHPIATSQADAPTAAVIDAFDARIVFPAYLAREPVVVRSATQIEAPAGSTLEITAIPRIATSRLELAVGDERFAMTRTAPATFEASFLVTEDAELAVLAREPSGRIVRDAERRAIRAVADAAPTVRLLAPEADMVIDLETTVVVMFTASDDVGVVAGDLVITTADGREHRRRVSSPESAQLELLGDTVIDAAELGAEPGDRISLRVEARDANDVTGPGIGRSETRTLTVASESTRRQDSILALEALRDAALDTLAGRLETPVVEEAGPAQQRFTLLSTETTGLVEALHRLSVDARLGEGRASDAPLFSAMSTRIRRGLTAERRLHDPTLGALPARTAADGAARSELEDDVLTLTDLLTRARVEDAAEVARELEALRQEIASLLREMRRAPTDEARAALLAAIGRAQQRLTELRERLSAMGSSAPSEFGNVTEETTEATQEALDQMRDALERGDQDAASQALTALEQQIDSIARSLGGGEESFMTEHFGPRDRALAEAMDALQGLEAEERELARHSSEARTAAAHDALESLGDQGAQAVGHLADEAASVGESLDGIRSGQLSTTQRESHAHARQRLRDAEDSLRAGDLGEASEMAEEAEAEADALARDLALDAMMFPGRGSQAGESARRATEATRRARELRSAIDRAIPDLRRHLSPEARATLRTDVDRQGRAAEGASGLADRFEHGPDGEPLVPDAADTVRQIRQLMDDAGGALEGEDSVSAADAQSEAARRLAELREQLEQDAQQRRSDSGGGSSMTELGRPVDIPEDHEGPMELRRRVLDAMSETAPSGYAESVRRYYEGLLR
jgi:hypothetical protein